MKYLHSALTSSARPFMDPKNVQFVKWIGIVVYVSAILCLYLTVALTYPGVNYADYTSIIAYIDWL
jgi:NADH:ubiquinone oxidoreductase subunit 6 (subunit J)